MDILIQSRDRMLKHIQRATVTRLTSTDVVQSGFPNVEAKCGICKQKQLLVLGGNFCPDHPFYLKIKNRV